MENKKLLEILFDKSNSKKLETALDEWNTKFHIKKERYCTCGKVHNIDMYEMKNNNNGNILHINVFQ